MYFCYFVIISPWERAGPSFEQTWILFSTGSFVPCLVETGSVLVQKKILNSVNLFLLFLKYLPLGMGRALIWTNLNPLHPRKGCVKIVWKLVQWFLRRRFLNYMYINVFLLFRNYLPLERGRALHLNKLESYSPEDDLCQICLKLIPWFLRRRFLNFVNVFLLFRNYLPLEKGWGLHLNKLESPSAKDSLCQIWLKLVQSFCSLDNVVVSDFIFKFFLYFWETATI